MELSLSMTGLPASVKAAVATQIKADSKAHQDAWPLLVDVRDYVARLIDAYGSEVPVSVDVTLSISCTAAPLGEPLNLTDTERQALPPLEPVATLMKKSA